MGGVKSLVTQCQGNIPGQSDQGPSAKSNKTDVFKLSNFLEGDDYSPAKVELIRRTVAKDCDDLELAYFLTIAKGVGLNPLVKEIWCYKDKRGNLIIFAGRDGFKRIVQSCPDFISMNSCEVREGDKFSRGTRNGEDYIEHEFCCLTGEGGKSENDRFRKRILGAWCIITIKRNGVIGRIVEWADYDRYNKGWNAWGTHPEEMIKKIPEVHAMKKVTNISGIYAEEEFSIIEDKETGKKVVDTGSVEGGNSRKEMLRQINAARAMAKINSRKNK